MIDDAITGTGSFVNYQTHEIGAVAFSSAVICSKLLTFSRALERHLAAALATTCNSVACRTGLIGILRSSFFLLG
jgi:hypothetical protein